MKFDRDSVYKLCHVLSENWKVGYRFVLCTVPGYYATEVLEKHFKAPLENIKREYGYKRWTRAMIRKMVQHKSEWGIKGI